MSVAASNESKPILVSDLGNVIVLFDMSIALRRFKLSFGLSMAKIQSFLLKNDIPPRLDTGELQPEQFHRLFLDRFKITMDFPEFCRYWNEIFSLNTEYLDFIRCYEKQFTFVILSNTNSVHWNYIEKKYPSIRKLFHNRILSFEEGIKKPDRKIFEKLFKFQADPEKMIFIDDLEENVAAARKTGIPSIQYTRFQTFKKEFLKLNPWRFKNFPLKSKDS